MQEPYGEGIAPHTAPESCVDGRKAGGEALTGARTGQPLSCEIKSSGTPTLLSEAEGHAEGGDGTYAVGELAAYVQPPPSWSG